MAIPKIIGIAIILGLLGIRLQILLTLRSYKLFGLEFSLLFSKANHLHGPPDVL